MKNPYEILGVSASSSKEELESRYNELKARYSEERFAQGSAGNEAAKKLSEIESAWLILSKEFAAEQEGEGNTTSSLPDIDNMIKAGRYDDAQVRLDAIMDRTAEWHYLQSIVYYKRDWFTECKNQLSMALSKEPNNSKYRLAMDKLQIVMAGPTVNPTQLGNNANPNNNMNRNNGTCSGSTLSDCCCAYCLADCCCSNAGNCC